MIVMFILIYYYFIYYITALIERQYWTGSRYKIIHPCKRIVFHDVVGYDSLFIMKKQAFVMNNKLGPKILI